LKASTLEEVIDRVLATLKEDKEKHIQGISAKIDRLRQAIRAAERGIENAEEAADGDQGILMDIRTQNSYWAKQQEIMNLNDKISLLLKQLQQLGQDAPGQLERGE
jgi:predicted  nucleic acid-binding Zn-ribbon protein